MRILIIEDEYKIAEAIQEALNNEGHETEIADDGQKGYEQALAQTFDVILLDVMLPLIDGYQVLEKLRKDNNLTPVLMLTAKSQLEDKLKGFRYGADDYLTKPFEIEELFARIYALTRRIQRPQKEDGSCGNLALNKKTCELYNKNTTRSVGLTAKEMKLLDYLMVNQGQVLTKDQISDRIWGVDASTEYNNAEVYVSFLRKKIKFIEANVNIKAVRGLGYKIEVTE